MDASATDRKSLSSQDILNRRLRWLMFFRVVTTTFLLATTIAVQFRTQGGGADTALAALYALIGTIFFFTFVYAVVLPRYFSEALQAYLQIFGDILTTTAVVYLTGGLESAFSFMYVLAVLNAGILLKMRGALLTASLSSIVYGALLDLHFYNYISPFMIRFFYVHYQPADILYTILMNMGAFYLVALLIGFLARQAEESRIELAERQSDLERLEELNETIIQSIDHGLMTLGPNGEILSFNPAAERITGYGFGQVRGRPYGVVFPGLDLDETPVGEEFPYADQDWRYLRSDGQTLDLGLNLLDLKDRGGGAMGRLLVIHDRTRLRRMEEEVKKIEKMAAIGAMAAAIAHEIRNPLASMNGSFQLLEEYLEGGEEAHRLTAIIRREIDRLKNIVSDFLLFARPRPSQPEPLDLSRIIEDLLGLFENQEEMDEAILLEKYLTPGLWIRFDRSQLEQVLWNLLQNAVTAMPGGGRLAVATRRTEDGDRMVELSVADTGVGIDSEDLSRIFDPFFTTKERGSGLGLAIVHRIVEGGGGRIEVESEPEEGTVFTIRLPLAEPMTAERIPEAPI